MASPKTLNAKNLEALGAPRLAELVMALVQGSAALKREARAALLEAAGPEALAAEVRKRLATIRRSRSRIDWQKRKAVLRDLTQQRDIVVERIAPDAPKQAFDLLWQFLDLHGGIVDRSSYGDDSLAEVFAGAVAALGPLAEAAKEPPQALAERVFRALVEGNGHGLYDGLVAAMSGALGEAGRDALRARLAAAQKEDPASGDIRQGLMALADLAGDTDAYIAQYPEMLRSHPRVAVDIASRLLAADRPAEALDALDAVTDRAGTPRAAVDARLAALEALDRRQEAQDLRWAVFQATLDPDYLRAHIQRLPDFDDVEAEDRALDFVAAHRSANRALVFLVEWKALDRAAALVMERRGALDADRYDQIAPAADALEARYPLAATVLRRAMVLDTLAGAKSRRYAHAARHLLECESADAAIDDYGPMPSHEAFVTRLRSRHGRKHGFWDLATP